MPIHVRDATPEDRAVIAEFNSRLAAETEDALLDPAVIGPGVARILGDRNLGRYWVAEVDGDVAGQIMATREWSDWRNGVLWWLQSVYVRSEYRRRGAFTALYRHVEILAREDPEVVGIRLYVEKDNARAREAYARLGMTMTNYRVMQTVFSDALHRREIR